jgi:hypothetical protein
MVEWYAKLFACSGLPHVSGRSRVLALLRYSMMMPYKFWSERGHVLVCIWRCSQPEITVHIHIRCKYVCVYVCMFVCMFVLQIKVTMDRPILLSAWAHQYNNTVINGLIRGLLVQTDLLTQQ